MRGQVTPACAVDHVIAIAKGGEAFPPLDGLMALCLPCHSEKTAAVDRAGGKGVRFKGAGLDGLPVDPAHPFFGAGAAAAGIPPSGTAAPKARTDAEVANLLTFTMGGPDPSGRAG